MLSPEQALARLRRLRDRSFERDKAMFAVRAIREGRMQDVEPHTFSEEFPKPLIANFVDVAVRDVSEVVGSLPSVQCRAAKSWSDAARKAADQRTHIARGYVFKSNLTRQLVTVADRMLTYGFGALEVEPCIADQYPRIVALDSFDSYYQLDRLGERTLYYGRFFRKHADDLAAEFPDMAARIEGMVNAADEEIDLIRWYDEDQQLVMAVDTGVVLARAQNPVSRCMVQVAEMPHLSQDLVRGAYDDVVWVQIAKARAARYAMEAMRKVVTAPLAVPTGTQEVPFGENALMTSDNPQLIRHVELPVPPAVFTEQSELSNELNLGSRYPEGRQGTVNASIVTGKGVEALMGTFSTQTRTAQNIIAATLQNVLSLCFEVDEKLWPNRRKSVVGTLSGSPFDVTYVPSKDIAGDYTVDVSYGTTAGLDPNRALVFSLQGLSAGVLSKDTVMHGLPIDIDVENEKREINLEQGRDALMQAMAGLAQAIPAMAMQGGDPSSVVSKIADFLGRRQRGDSIEVAAGKVFAPPPPPPSTPAQEGGVGPAGTATPAGPPSGIDPQTGLPVGVAPGGAQLPKGSAQDLLQTLAGTTPSGNPNLSMAVSRRQGTVL